jgi:4a-hydroxytetrahydrobiopterin dehydratase
VADGRRHQARDDTRPEATPAIPNRRGRAMSKLTEAEIAGRLPAAKGWERLGDMLVRSWHFPSSRRALGFVTDVVDLAERSGHHPDIVLSYRTVRLELSTHAVGGVTDADFSLLAQIETIPADR